MGKKDFPQHFLIHIPLANSIFEDIGDYVPSAAKIPREKERERYRERDRERERERDREHERDRERDREREREREREEEKKRHSYFEKPKADDEASECYFCQGAISGDLKVIGAGWEYCLGCNYTCRGFCMICWV